MVAAHLVDAGGRRVGPSTSRRISASVSAIRVGMSRLVGEGHRRECYPRAAKRARSEVAGSLGVRYRAYHGTAHSMAGASYRSTAAAVMPRPATLYDRCDRPVALRLRRGGPDPDAHHARARQDQGDRQGHPAPDVADRGEPRAVRRAEARPRPRADVRRVTQVESSTRGCGCGTTSSRSGRRRTSPSWPTARSRSGTPRSRSTCS